MTLSMYMAVGMALMTPVFFDMDTPDYRKMRETLRVHPYPRTMFAVLYATIFVVAAAWPALVLYMIYTGLRGVR